MAVRTGSSGTRARRHTEANPGQLRPRFLQGTHRSHQRKTALIVSVYQGGSPPPDFKPDRKKMGEMERFNLEMGNALTIESLDGLGPLARELTCRSPMASQP
jgi:hypothetical protein